MIAVVTSTVKPGLVNKSFYNLEERIAQTKKTLNRLVTHDFKSIYLVDNSPSLNINSLKEIFTDYQTVNLFHVSQYQFQNKGINELLMLLFLTDHLPLNTRIFKISARYYPNEKFIVTDFKDLAVKGFDFFSRRGTISTRGYWIKDVEILRDFSNACLKEIFAYPEKITGLRSFINNIRRAFFGKPFTPITVSVEFAAANVLKKHGLAVTLLPAIGLEGLVAGADKIELLQE